MNGFPAITLMMLAPLFGGFILLGLGAHQKSLARKLGLLFSVIPLGLACWMCGTFENAGAGLQFVERHQWIPTLGIEYFTGVDGLGLVMVLLTGLLTPMAIMASWKIEDRVPMYFALVLFLESGLLGVFTALNFFHWFIFWEIGLIPAFFLIKLWGGPQRHEAAVQFFVYTMAGSVCLLLSFLGLYVATGTFDFLDLQKLAHDGLLTGALQSKLAGSFLSKDHVAMVIFIGALLGFAVKVPLMPFHTWLPMTYAEAPTGTTMLLTGVMSKMGVYGFLRILLPIFPEQVRQALPVLLGLAVITIIFSACAAFAQKDLKRTLAYSSINHLGYCLLGAFAACTVTVPGLVSVNEKAAAINGVILQMFNHGLTAAALFCFVGFLEQRSGGKRGLNDFGGLAKVVPVFTALMGISLFASLGLPGLNGFVGEFLIFKGTFALAGWAAALSTIGLLVSAVFLLTVIRKVFHGPVNAQWSGMKDLTMRELMTVGPAVALMFVLGVYPRLLVDLTNWSVVAWIDQMK